MEETTIDVQEVAALPQATYEVHVQDAVSSTTHTVHVDEAYVSHLGLDTDVSTLVRQSFVFLLRREPKEAILREFHLRDITKYFPEFEQRLPSLL